jgi:uncharacterized protein involved in type VI secretion and phage assembly
MEWYEHQALVVQNGVKPEKTDASSALEKRAEVRMEELTGLFSVCTGPDQVQDFTVGGTFKLEGRLLKTMGEYLIVSAVYRAEFNDHASNPDLRPDRRGKASAASSCARASMTRRPTVRPGSRPKP